MAKDFHYFAGNMLNWSVSDDLYDVIRMQKQRDRSGSYKMNGCSVYKVPISLPCEYGIRDYLPEVDGLEFIDSIYYLEKDRKKARE